MPARALSIRISAIAHATEDPAKVAQAMSSLSLGEMPAPKGRKTSGHYGNEIRVLETESHSSSISERVLASLWARFAALDQEEVLSNMSQHVNEVGRLYVRVDKQLACKGKLKLAQAESIKIELSFDLHGVGREQTTQIIAGKLRDLMD